MRSCTAAATCALFAVGCAVATDDLPGAPVATDCSDQEGACVQSGAYFVCLPSLTAGSIRLQPSPRLEKEFGTAGKEVPEERSHDLFA